MIYSLPTEQDKARWAEQVRKVQTEKEIHYRHGDLFRKNDDAAKKRRELWGNVALFYDALQDGHLPADKFFNLPSSYCDIDMHLQKHRSMKEEFKNNTNPLLWRDPETPNLFEPAMRWRLLSALPARERAILLGKQPMDQAETKRKFQLYTVSEIRNLPRRKYLVKGILDQGTLSVVYGESNSGKSLLVINICCNIVMGSPWIGNKSRAGTAIYVAAEGGYGIADRLEAARLAGQIDDTAPFFILPTTVNLSKDDTDVNEFIKEIDRLESRPGIIVIDTLARAMAGGDENSGKDMGILIANCDIIRQHTGAHVLIVHHTGKNIALGARGHSSLKAAIETEIFVSQDRDKIITAEISKQRDGATGGKYSFELKVFNIREDEDGENVTSCALTPAHGIIETIKLSKTARLARDTLQALMLSTGDEAMEALGHRAVKIQTFHEKLMTSDISSADNLDSRKKAIVRAINTLKEQGIISLCETYVWFTDNLDKSGQNQKDILP